VKISDAITGVHGKARYAKKLGELSKLNDPVFA
jgi:hypothetical protein